MRRAARSQLAAEIEAQFAAHHATGLPLDHVDTHHHFHAHPTVTMLILDISRRFGMRGIRAPIESPDLLARTDRYRYADELAALTSPAVKDALSASGARRGGFPDLAPR